MGLEQKSLGLIHAGEIAYTTKIIAQSVKDEKYHSPPGTGSKSYPSIVTIIFFLTCLKPDSQTANTIIIRVPILITLKSQHKTLKLLNTFKWSEPLNDKAITIVSKKQYPNPNDKENASPIKKSFPEPVSKGENSSPVIEGKYLL